MGVSIPQNTVRNLAKHYRETGQIRPDVTSSLKLSTEKPDASDYEGLMDTMSLMAQSSQNGHGYRADDATHELHVQNPEIKTQNFDLIQGAYTGDAQSGELKVTDQLGEFRTPERRTIQHEVFFAPDSIVAFSRTSGQALTIDLVDRKDPSGSARFEIPAGSEWLTR